MLTAIIVQQPKPQLRRIANLNSTGTMLTGFVLGFELVTMPPQPPQMIFLALGMIELGDMAVWKPEFSK